MWYTLWVRSGSPRSACDTHARLTHLTTPQKGSWTRHVGIPILVKEAHHNKLAQPNTQQPSNRVLKARDRRLKPGSLHSTSKQLNPEPCDGSCSASPLSKVALFTLDVQPCQVTRRSTRYQRSQQTSSDKQPRTGPTHVTSSLQVSPESQRTSDIDMTPEPQPLLETDTHPTADTDTNRGRFVQTLASEHGLLLLSGTVHIETQVLEREPVSDVWHVLVTKHISHDDMNLGQFQRTCNIDHGLSRTAIQCSTLDCWWTVPKTLLVSPPLSCAHCQFCQFSGEGDPGHPRLQESGRAYGLFSAQVLDVRSSFSLLLGMSTILESVGLPITPTLMILLS